MKSPRRKPKRLPAARFNTNPLVRGFAAFFLFLVFFALGSEVRAETVHTHKVRQVIDGDTLVLGDYRKIRLIGVDAPELEHRQSENQITAQRTGIPLDTLNDYALKAKDFLTQNTANEEIYLKLDSANASRNHKDRFGRTLAYVYRKRDHLLLNEALIREGYGLPTFQFSYSQKARFMEMEKEARNQHKGLWRL